MLFEEFSTSTHLVMKWLFKCLSAQMYSYVSPICMYFVVCVAVADEIMSGLDKKESKSEIKIAAQLDAFCGRDDLDSKRHKLVSFLFFLQPDIHYALFLSSINTLFLFIHMCVL